MTLYTCSNKRDTVWSVSENRRSSVEKEFGPGRRPGRASPSTLANLGTAQTETESWLHTRRQSPPSTGSGVRARRGLLTLHSARASVPPLHRHCLHCVRLIPASPSARMSMPVQRFLSHMLTPSAKSILQF